MFSPHRKSEESEDEVAEADHGHEDQAGFDVEGDVGDIDYEPSAPTIDFLLSREVLGQEDEGGDKGIEVGRPGHREGVGPPHIQLAEQGAPAEGEDGDKGQESDAFLVGQHGNFQLFLAVLFVLGRVGPSVVAEEVDDEGNGLHEHAGIQVLLQEHKEQQDVVQVADPKVEDLASRREEDTTQSGNHGQQFEQTYALSAQRKQNIINAKHRNEIKG